MTTIFNELSRSAVSLAVSGNVGVAPFLTLFLVSVIEKYDPTLLDTGENMESWITAWPTIAALAILTILEFIAKCVPVIDEFVDSAVTFIVPVASVLASLTTMGMYGTNPGATGNENNLNGTIIQYNEVGIGESMLEPDGVGGNLTSSALLTFQIFIVVVGVILALSIHFCKMLIRLLGEGCLTGCITVVEDIFCIVTVTISLLFPGIAIAIACAFLCLAVYNIKRRFCDKRREEEEQQQQIEISQEDNNQQSNKQERREEQKKEPIEIHPQTDIQHGMDPNHEINSGGNNSKGGKGSSPENDNIIWAQTV